MSHRSILSRPAGLVVVLLVVPALVLAAALAPPPGSAGCGGGAGSASASKSPGGPVVLTVAGAKGSKSFTLAELEALPAYTGYAGIKDSVGVVTAPVQYTGVPLATLTAQVGGVDPSLRRDGARQGRLRHDLLGRPGGRRRLCDLRPGHRRRAPAGHRSSPCWSPTRARASRSTRASEGPLRLVFAEPKADIVVDGHWSVRWVDKVEVKKSLGQWSVSVQGATSSTLTAGLVCVVRLAGLSRQRLYRQDRRALGGHSAVARGRLGRRRSHARRRGVQPSPWPRRATRSS